MLPDPLLPRGEPSKDAGAGPSAHQHPWQDEAGTHHGARLSAGGSHGIRKLIEAQRTETVSVSDTYYTTGRLPGPSSVWLEPASPQASWEGTPSEKPRQQSSLQIRRREVLSNDETFWLPSLLLTSHTVWEEDVRAVCVTSTGRFAPSLWARTRGDREEGASGEHTGPTVSPHRPGDGPP